MIGLALGTILFVGVMAPSVGLVAAVIFAPFIR